MPYWRKPKRLRYRGPPIPSSPTPVWRPNGRSWILALIVWAILILAGWLLAPYH